MEINELQQALETCAFELVLEHCLHQYKLAQDDERTRRLRVQLLILECENDDLHAQIVEGDGFVEKVESNQAVLREQAKMTEACLETAQGEIRIKAREIEILKAELSSLHGVTMDSTKLLTEKLALARELSSLRPEVDHLRSQAASNQSLLAEKLSLEHRIGTLQMELETEKKLTKRILAREGKARAEDTEVQCQIHALRVDLDHERREKQKVERETQQSFATWDAQKLALESRLDSLRNKVKTTKETLKETQQKLQNARSSAKPTAVERAASTITTTAELHTRKRTASQMLSDPAIGTPGDAANGRRSKRSSTLPGDKSTFSITPYLNRTASLAPESPEEALTPTFDVTKTVEGPRSAREAVDAATEGVPAPATDQRRSKKIRALGVTRTSKTNMRAVQGQGKPKATAKLENVAEEVHDENGQILESRSKTVDSLTEDSAVLIGGDAKKTKRKFLGNLSKTLFDEDDRETTKPAPAGSRSFGSLSRGTLAGPENRPPFKVPSTSSNGFGAFSPLKRNIRPSA
ncbi:MAG: hypothetical protein Q9211_001542 [Gyalolechia sp. 1 TL-2023]